MKRGILLPLLLASCGAWAGDLELALQGSGITGSTLYIAVHSSPDDFPVRDAKAIKRATVATGPVTRLVISGIPAGEYAVAVYADLNGNGELDSNFIGIPREPVGISNNAKGRFGPPKFADAAFRVGDGMTRQAITLQ